MQKKGKKPKKGSGKGDSNDKSGKGKKRQSAVAEYVSDDEKIYGNHGEDPDPEYRDFYYDDEDEFHEGRDQILLEQGQKVGQDLEYQSEEEEVLALDSEDSDDDEIRDLKAKLRQVQKLQRKSQYGSDLEDGSSDEGDEEEDGLPDDKAWGKKRSRYYGDDDIEVADLHDEEAEAVLEEKEAMKLQKKLAEQLDDQDFGLDMFAPQEKDKSTKSSEEKIVKDLSKLSKREKLKILKKKSPELLTLIEEFKERMTEVTSSLNPMKHLLERQKCTGKAVDYINTKFRLNLNYCTNILFYLMLQAKQLPVHNHPVIKRILQHKNMLKQLEPIDEQFKGEMAEILKKLNSGEDVQLQIKTEKPFVRRQRVATPRADKRKIKQAAAASHSDSENSEDLYEEGPMKKKLKDDRYLTEDEKQALEYYDMMKAGRKPDPEEVDGEDNEEMEDEVQDDDEDMYEEEEDGKRAITYQIEKNKGLTVRKKKELRNPRVKHRMKYRKAKIRRKAQVQEVKRETQKYGGELSGIRASVARSIKLKN